MTASVSMEPVARAVVKPEFGVRTVCWLRDPVNDEYLHTAAQLAAARAEGRREGLEEAAKACRLQFSTLSMHVSSRECIAYNDGVRDCEKSINSLITKGTP